MMPDRRSPTTPLLLATLIGALVAGCAPSAEPTSAPSSASAQPSASSSPPASPSAPTAPATTPATTAASPDPTIAAEPPPLALEEVGSGFASPINITGAPDGSLLVNEQGGRVVRLDPSSGETAVTLDISDRVRSGGEQGLLGLALHPDWPETPRAFVHYSDLNGDTVLSEFTTADDSAPPVLDPGSERVMLQVDQPYANHNGGQLAFGPDGHLYMALGDGGAGGDPEGNGQNPTTLLGSILRIDVDGAADDNDPAYGIPSDNPFADGADGAPEVYLYGLRNPWRFSFDPATDALWIADVGQNAFEEVNRLDPVADAGANLGWNVMEASHCFAEADCSTEGLVLPVTEYGRDLGCSITGGYVYRGSVITDLAGWYVFSDYCAGTLYGVRSDVTELTAPRALLETDASVSAFGQDADGELYVADLDGGSIYRIVAGD